MLSVAVATLVAIDWSSAKKRAEDFAVSFFNLTLKHEAITQLASKYERSSRAAMGTIDEGSALDVNVTAPETLEDVIKRMRNLEITLANLSKGPRNTGPTPSIAGDPTLSVSSLPPMDIGYTVMRQMYVEAGEKMTFRVAGKIVMDRNREKKQAASTASMSRRRPPGHQPPMMSSAARGT